MLISLVVCIVDGNRNHVMLKINTDPLSMRLQVSRLEPSRKNFILNVWQASLSLYKKGWHSYMQLYHLHVASLSCDASMYAILV